VALLNARERHCFETLSLVGQKNDSNDASKHSKHTADSASTSNVTALKVYLILSSSSLHSPGTNSRKIISDPHYNYIFTTRHCPAALIVDERKLLFWKKCFCLQM